MVLHRQSPLEGVLVSLSVCATVLGFRFARAGVVPYLTPRGVSLEMVPAARDVDY